MNDRTVRDAGLPIRILLVDDHTLFRSGLASLLSEFEEIVIVFEAVNGSDLQSKIKKNEEVQLILMDINMPVVDGFAATKWIKEQYPHIYVLALSMFEDEKSIINMIKAGANGYLLKESKPSEVLIAIKAMLEKGFYVNELVSGRLLVSIKNEEPKNILTEKELTFLPLPKEVVIAERLLEFEKDRKKMKVILKTNKLEGGASFHEKAKKNTKVNLGGPSKTKKKTGTSVNRNILKNRAAKRKKK